MIVNRKKHNKNNNKNNLDIFAILLTIVSAFFLLCLIIPVIFAFISAGVQFFLLGTFGIFSYILCAAGLAIGIALLLNKVPRFDNSILACVIGGTIILFMIIHLISTHGFLTAEPALNFGEYLAAVYGARFTGGGAIFGLFAGGIAMLITPVGAYIVFGISLAAVLTLLGRKIYFIVQPKKAVQRKTVTLGASSERSQEPSNADNLTAYYGENQAVTANTEPSYKTPRTYISLFCETIQKQNAQLNASEPHVQSSKNSVLSDNNVEALRDPSRRMNPEDAKSRLYVDNMGAKSKSTSNAVKANHNALNSYDLSGVEAADEIETPRVNKSPRASLYGTGNKAPVLPTPKNDLIFVPGEIISANSGSLDKKNTAINDSISASPNSFDSTNGLSDDNDDDIVKNSNFFTQPSPIVTESPELNSMEGQDVRENKSTESVINQSPIIKMKDDAEEINADKVKPNAVTAGNYNPIKPQTEDLNKSPIINFAYLNSISHSGGESRSNDEDNRSDDDYIAPPVQKTYNPAKTTGEQKSGGFTGFFSDAANDSAKPRENVGFVRRVESDRENDNYNIVNSSSIVNSGSESVYEEADDYYSGGKPFGLVVDDKVVDKTEREFDFGDDNTGYYESEEAKPSVTKPKQPRIPRNAPLPGQITIDDAIKSNAEKSANIDEIIKNATPYNYNPPTVDLLKDPIPVGRDSDDEIENKRMLIESTLNELKYPAEVINVVKGPTITRFELRPPVGMSVRKILDKGSDIEFAIATKGVRIEAPIAGMQAIGIEVPNSIRATVQLKELINVPEFQESNYILPLALGKDLGGKPIIRGLEKMPHLLVAGATGSGKSVCLNSIILGLMYRCSPADLRIVLVDPKCVEFTPYRKVPHLLIPNPITEPQHAINAFDWAIQEMENRFTAFSLKTVRNIGEYNKLPEVVSGKIAKQPYIVFVVDELADLMLSRKREVEERIRKITQKSRAAGIHLILATQRPSVDVITGTIKGNLPCRIALNVISNIDSRTVIDQGGAESLVGNGDMLFMPHDSPDLKRLQGAYVDDEELTRIVSTVIDNNAPMFDAEIESAIYKSNETIPEINTNLVIEEESADEKLLPSIMRTIISSHAASTSMLQRRFSIGYSRAARIIDIIEQRGWIAQMDGSNRAREVLMTVGQYEEVFDRPFDEEE